MCRRTALVPIGHLGETMTTGFEGTKHRTRIPGVKDNRAGDKGKNLKGREVTEYQRTER